MNSRPWYKRYGSDFISGTLGMTLEEKGAYSILLDLIYDRGGPIPDDARYIAGVCGCSVRKWNTIRDRLIALGKIAVFDGVISNSRADKELEISAKSADERAESGRKGGEKSAQKRGQPSRNNELDQAELDHTRAVQIPETRNQRNTPLTPQSGERVSICSTRSGRCSLGTPTASKPRRDANSTPSTPRRNRHVWQVQGPTLPGSPSSVRPAASRLIISGGSSRSCRPGSQIGGGRGALSTRAALLSQW
ncbi:DUF1376 domain-containing protein [Youhaiella tibetensis]|uniref:DUF1376 domain-containing protein n=1 Tax=Paradevosia tibetensis TaxID=1447062 RepID=A0A5B9DN33_9HYPH|nr:YdaU family protein [Youhaiella tibetensis]QEE20402.1 DUF1376 domain-containing protein [Youhaiella tibetensis]